MLKTNKQMYILLGIMAGIHILTLVFNSLFYFEILGPNSNKDMKTWFFKQVESNMSSRALEEISLESLSECSFPTLNLFGFGYPRADSVQRYCMCQEDGDFAALDSALANGEDVTPLLSSVSCKSPAVHTVNVSQHPRPGQLFLFE